MLRFLVVTLEVLALIMILRSAYVQLWLSDMQTSTSQWMHSIAMTLDNQQLTTFRNGISEYVQNLTDPQMKYLYKITSTKTELNSFYLHYCRQGDKNPFIYGANLHYVCGEISRMGILKV
jgi:uncharacterized protein YjiK